MDELEPLFATREQGPLFTVGEASERMRQTGEDAGPIATQLRGYLQRNLVHFRDKKGSGRTAHQRLAWSDILAARILRALNAAGVADLDILRAASHACYAWEDTQRAPKGMQHPVSAAVMDSLDKNQAWLFRLDVLQHHQTGARKIDAYLYNADEHSFGTEEGFLSLVTVTIPAFLFVPAIRRDTTGAN